MICTCHDFIDRYRNDDFLAEIINYVYSSLPAIICLHNYNYIFIYCTYLYVYIISYFPYGNYFCLMTTVAIDNAVAS